MDDNKMIVNGMVTLLELYRTNKGYISVRFFANVAVEDRLRYTENDSTLVLSRIFYKSKTDFENHKVKQCHK